MVPVFNLLSPRFAWAVHGFVNRPRASLGLIPFGGISTMFTEMGGNKIGYTRLRYGYLPFRALNPFKALPRSALFSLPIIA